MRLTITRVTCGKAQTLGLSAQETNQLRHILCQFPADIFAVVPIRRDGDPTSWILPDLTLGQRSNIGLFKSLKFNHIFKNIQYKAVDDSTWEGLIFDRYFPPKGEVLKSTVQSFRKACYYQEWNNLLESVGETRDTKEIRSFVLKWFSKLCWLPFPESDRPWKVKQPDSKQWKMVPPGKAQKCLRIAIRRSGKLEDSEVAEMIAEANGLRK